MSNNKGTVDNNYETKRVHIDAFCQNLAEFGTKYAYLCLRMVRG